MEFPILYYKGKGGALYSWRVWSEGDAVEFEYGQVGGKMHIGSFVCKPKNVGRSNATSAVKQADKEAKALWKHKVDRKYSETPEEAKEELCLPMLAQDYTKRIKKVNFPVSVQPKLDGVRCIAKWVGDEIHLISRGGKRWNCSVISDELTRLLPKDTILDGEIYIHGYGFQSITKLVKKVRPESVNLQYHVYDCPMLIGVDECDWSIREINLDKIREIFAESHVVRVIHSIQANNHDDVVSLHGEYVNQGYEGAIIRQGDGKYTWGYRSYDLLKFKNFDDCEYEIVSFKEGIGKFVGTIIFECITAGGKIFDVVPKGSMEDKKIMFTDGPSYIGKLLTVKYFGLTDDGIPRFPVGLGFRDNADM
jgi:DNA ligase-1